MRRVHPTLPGLAVAVSFASRAVAEQRFPPPDFESGYHIPTATTPPGHGMLLQYADVAILALCLGVAVWLIYQRRSRRGIFWLSLLSLGYFGFYRKGCICPIGSPQNIACGLLNPEYAVPVSVIAFFALPLVASLFAGRAFCSAVCPHGALQDLVLLKPVKLPQWLEQGLSTVPFLLLGGGIACAASGIGFLICRIDPFVPLFRLSGTSTMITLGFLTLALGTVVGRPYCRFLCPYGAMLKLGSSVSKWRVTITPNECTKCRLCENSCPYGAIREPSPDDFAGKPVERERRRLGWLVIALPILALSCAWAGYVLAPAAASLHPTVALAERYVRFQQHPTPLGVMTPESLSLARAQENPQATLDAAEAVRKRFRVVTALFGAWVGVVLGVKLISLSPQRKRLDYEPDRGACFACARCFADCPNERFRLGLPGEIPSAALTETPQPVTVK
jgi:ferredoxin